MKASHGWSGLWRKLIVADCIHSFNHSPKLVTIDEGWNTDQQLNPWLRHKLSFLATLLQTQHHSCSRSRTPSYLQSWARYPEVFELLHLGRWLTSKTLFYKKPWRNVKRSSLFKFGLCLDYIGGQLNYIQQQWFSSVSVAAAVLLCHLQCPWQDLSITWPDDLKQGRLLITVAGRILRVDDAVWCTHDGLTSTCTVYLCVCFNRHCRCLWTELAWKDHYSRLLHSIPWLEHLFKVCGLDSVKGTSDFTY